MSVPTARRAPAPSDNMADHPTHSRRQTSRLLATVVAAVVAPLLVLTTPGAASAAPTRDRAAAGAGWAGRQLGPHHVVTGAFGPDYGLTADVVLALDAAGVGRAAARKATKALRRHVLDYTGFGDPKEFYAGSFAKLLVVTDAQGADPRHFGASRRNNLVRVLRTLQCGSGGRVSCPAGDKGRFSDVSQFGDFSNTFTQSLALIGLERTTAKGAPRVSVHYLRKQQCGNGGFPEALSTAGCTPSVDATGFAVQALLAAGHGKARAAGLRAARWLRRHQHGNGSFTGNGVRNTNSTGLAAQALQVAGRDRAAAKARGFLRRLQVGCAGAKTDRGQIRYDRSGSGDALRASAQAVPALARVGLADVSVIHATRGLPRLRCS